MACSESESYTFRFVDSELIPCGSKEEMAISSALHAPTRRAPDSGRTRSGGSSSRPPKWDLDPVRCASPLAVRSVWHPNIVAEAQPLAWRSDSMAIIDGTACLPWEAEGAGGHGSPSWRMLPSRSRTLWL